jgi:transposase-like protein
LYLRFTLSFRDVEDLLAKRGITVSHETIRRWVVHFGPIYARRLRARRLPSPWRWHLDEVFVSIGGRQMYLWRAVDDEGEVLDFLVQSKRDKDGALRLMRKLLKRQGLAPTAIVTDGYRAYDAALRDLGLSHLHRPLQRFVVIVTRPCGPLANSRFHHQPDARHQPDSRLEAAYHRADAAFQKVVNLLAAA